MYLRSLAAWHQVCLLARGASINVFKYVRAGISPDFLHSVDKGMSIIRFSLRLVKLKLPIMFVVPS